MRRKRMIASGVIVSVGTVAIVYALSSKSSSPEAAARRPQRIALGTSAMPAAASRAEFHERIRKRLAAQPAAESLAPAQRDNLVERCAGIVSTYAAGELADFQSLMTTWGGRPRDSSFESWAAGLWPHPSGRFPWRRIDVDQLAARAVRLEADGSLSITSGATGSPQFFHESSFAFRQSAADLARQGADIIEIAIPVEGGDGAATRLEFLFVWSAIDRAWLPYLLVQRVNAGDGGVELVF